MTREEAKELLIHVLMTYEPRDQYGDCDDPEPYEEAMTMAIEALSESKIRWIPVSESLPIPPTFCLVTTDGSHGDVIDIALYMSDGWHKASEVIAWMPLPSPYEGGESE